MSEDQSAVNLNEIKDTTDELNVARIGKQRNNGIEHRTGQTNGNVSSAAAAATIENNCKATNKSSFVLDNVLL